MIENRKKQRVRLHQMRVVLFAFTLLLLSCGTQQSTGKVRKSLYLTNRTLNFKAKLRN